MSSTISVVIADDHPTFRVGVRSLLQAEPDLPLIGEASNAADAVDRTLTLKPDILLLDLKMPPQAGLKISPRAGLDVLRGLNVGTIKTKTILFAAELEIDEIVEALQLGAHGVLLKDAATQLLGNCIGTVITGGCWVARQSVPSRDEYLEIYDPASYRLHKLGMRKTIKVAAEICIYDFSMASVDQLMDVSYGVQCAAVFPIGVLFRLQVGFEYGFEHQNCGHFRCPVADSGYS